ncbi:hypothetical protein EIP86_006684 [Pleurotus ostreatoroseus]|nr:hypothetical protein EIP86_006684 [Pleurotus ostreatoroseus]
MAESSSPIRTNPKAAPSFVQVNGEMVEFTKTGNVSRMRAHKGNKPGLPQNHLCHLCPAKFTRVTHLHRHLRTHTNERSHQCDKCGTQFTRSDLLTRHKRSCGDPANANRSRRKSCQACADGKTKCDLGQPCTRCKARDRECVYVRTPATRARRSNTLESRAGASSSGSPEEIVQRLPLVPDGFEAKPAVTSNSPRGAHLDTVTPSSAAPELYPSIAGAPPSFLSTQQLSAHVGFAAPNTFHDFRDAGAADDLSSYASSVFSDGTEGHVVPGVGGLHGAGSFAHDALEVTHQLNALFSAELFDKFFRDASTENPIHVGLDDVNDVSFLDTIQFPFPTDTTEMQPFMASMPPPGLDLLNLNQELLTAHISAPRTNTNANAIHDMSTAYHLADPTLDPRAIPYPSEFQHYIQLFYNMFLAQMPVMHVGTFTVDGKPAILIAAMQACGALYVRTHAAMKFIDDTLASARDQLVGEFAKIPTRWEDQVHLILAVVLLQTIGLFHQRPQQRSHSNLYHSMLVAMIRQSGLIERVAAWVPPNVEDEVSWKEWACHETTKRALLLSYLHDCCHCIYFTLQPAFARAEVAVPLPCEDGLWRANTWREWRAVLGTPSAYGSRRARFCPPNLQTALARLASDNTLSCSPSSPDSPHTSPTPPLLVTPFAHFVLSHAILRQLFEDCLDRRPLDAHAGGLAVQLMLHNWLQSWLRSPETPDYAHGEPLFLHDALPFYWIAQVTLLAYQEGLPPFATQDPAGGSVNMGAGALGEAKFRLIKEWLRHIRAFLCRGQEGPTLFWDELTKIRMKAGAHGGSDTESVSADSDSSQGLLGFFAGDA